MSTTPTSPPGWYPQNDGTRRYWDGSAWTSRVASPDPAYGAALAAYFAPLSPQDGQPWPPIATSPGRYAVGPSAQPLITYGHGAQAVAAKSPGLALAASFLVPGLGQLINNEIAKGIVFFVAYVVGIVAVLVVLGFVIVPVVWIWAMVDAYSSAKQWNLRHGILA